MEEGARSYATIISDAISSIQFRHFGTFRRSNTCIARKSGDYVTTRKTWIYELLPHSINKAHLKICEGGEI
jgi:hypothetical protein